MGLYQGWGEKDYRDVLAAVDHAIELGYADADRLGVGNAEVIGLKATLDDDLPVAVPCLFLDGMDLVVLEVEPIQVRL